MPMKFETPPSQNLETPLKYKVLNALNVLLKPFDKQIGQKRAEDLIARSEILDYFEENGVYLDIGTGPGHIMEQMLKQNKEKNVKMLGLDPFVKPFEAVRERLDQEPDLKHLFVKGAGQQLPIKEKSLNGAILFFAIHHIPPEDREQLFAEIERIIKDDGEIFLIEDTPQTQEEAERVARWDRRLNVEPSDEEHSYFSDDDWKQFFKQHGYELVHEAHFTDESKKKKEGVIPHSSYVLQLKQKINQNN